MIVCVLCVVDGCFVCDLFVWFDMFVVFVYVVGCVFGWCINVMFECLLWVCWGGWFDVCVNGVGWCCWFVLLLLVVGVVLWVVVGMLLLMFGV